MRIAYMLTSLGIGGAERQVIALAERMKTHGHEVTLIVLRAQQPREWPTSIPVFRLDMRKSPLGVLAGLLRGRRILQNFKPDILHSHTFPANMAARAERLMGTAPAVLSTIHNVYEGGWARTLAYRITGRLSMHTTAVSEAVAARHIRVGAVPRRKCSVVTNGIDLAEFSPEGKNGSLARELMHASDDFVWLAAGRPVPAKDFDNLLAAFRRVRVEFPQSQLWIAGQLAETRFARVNGEVVGTEIYGGDRVRWLGLRDDMAETIAPADAFVLTSAWEGMPLVVGEAMAMEKPVVATDVGGVGELVGEAGVIVPAKDSAALAAAMLRVMRSSPAERADLGKAARERIRLHFDVDAKADEWEALYLRLLSAATSHRKYT